MRSFALALRFLSALPLPGDPAVDDDALARSVGWYPAVGLLLGGLLAALALGVRATGLSPLFGAALLAVAAPALTGGLHEDGLGDAADGLGGGWTAERALEIMRDPRVGSFGALAISGALLLRFAALAGADPAAWPLWLLAAGGLSRLAPALLLQALPYARAEGPGLARPMIEGVGRRELALSLGFGAFSAALPGPAPGLAALGLTLALTAALGAWFRRRVGGLTGDLAGAAVVLVELAVLALGATLNPAAA